MDWNYSKLLPLTIQMNMMYAHWKSERNGLQWDAERRRDRRAPMEDAYDQAEYLLLLKHIGRYCDSNINIWCSSICPWAMNTIMEMPSES